jgi:protein-serine/threonine kinase
MKDRGQLDSGRNTDFFSRYVFGDDAEDIKAHRWFKGVPWDHLHTMSPPFIPNIESVEDTHYFEEDEPIEDWSESLPSPGGLSPEDVKAILCDFREGVQITAMQLVATPYDSAKLRTIDQQIDAIVALATDEKAVLKHFVRLYGRKERKRPRDRLLRDAKTKNIVMEVRKQTAFLGYTWRRMRPEGYY